MAACAWPPGRVLDLTRLLPGPLAGKLLWGMGFPVLKVEPPGGDPLKALAPEAYRFLNGEKEVLRLDLKRPEGREALLDLARKSAVLLDSNRPGVMERLGLGPEVLLGANPRLVYARLRGYRESADPGHDLTYLAEAGLPELLGAAFSPASPDNPAYARLCARFLERPALLWEAWAREEGVPLRAVRG